MGVEYKLEHHNNFDLIRLFAASQVMVQHTVYHLKIEPDRVSNYFLDVFSYFPGVPIFFIISGFLISNSWVRKPLIRQYAANRILRIMPALWVCLAFSLIVTYSMGSLVVSDMDISFFSWILSEVLFGHLFSHNAFQGFGTGVLNGSLWTIPVEIQFYLILPGLFFILTRLNKKFALIVLFVLGIASWLAGKFLVILDDSEKFYVVFKLYEKTLLPYFFYFLIGIFFSIYFNRLKYLFSNKSLYWLPAYVVSGLMFSTFTGRGFGGNSPGVVESIFLAFVVFSVAFSHKNIGHICLRGKDLSYGVYIYHMVIVNILVESGYMSTWLSCLLAVLLTYFMAFLSWQYVESKALSYKNSFAGLLEKIHVKWVYHGK